MADEGAKMFGEATEGVIVALFENELSAFAIAIDGDSD